MKTTFTIRELRIPLKNPEALHSGELNEYHMYIIEAQNEAGDKGYGELLSIPDDNPQHQTVNIPAIINCINGQRTISPYVVTAVNTAIETIGLEYPALRVPICGSVTNPDTVKEEVELFAKKGYEWVKVRLFSKMLDDEVEYVRDNIYDVMNANPNIKFIFDCAKCFTNAAELRKFEFLLLPNAEYIIDPHRENQYGHKIGKATVVRDRDMWFAPDFQKQIIANHRNKQQHFAVKQLMLRLPKHGALLGAEKMIHSANSYAMEPLFGSGIAGDITCLNEMLVYQRKNLPMPGMMDGFLKQKHRIVRGTQLKHSRNYALFEGGKVDIDWDAIKNKVIDETPKGEPVYMLISEKVVVNESEDALKLREYPRLW